MSLTRATIHKTRTLTRAKAAAKLRSFLDSEHVRRASAPPDAQRRMRRTHALWGGSSGLAHGGCEWFCTCGVHAHRLDTAPPPLRRHLLSRRVALAVRPHGMGGVVRGLYARRGAEGSQPAKLQCSRVAKPLPAVWFGSGG